MRRWLVLVLALVIALASSRAIRAQDANASFQRVEFTVDPEAKRPTAHRLALTSPTDAEITLVRGALSEKGKWSLVCGPLVRFVDLQGLVHVFRVAGDSIQDTSGAGYMASRDAPWLFKRARDPGLAKQPDVLRGGDGHPDFGIVRYSALVGDWIGPQDMAVAVTLESKSPGTLLVRFPDGTARTLAETGGRWVDRATATESAQDEERNRKRCVGNLAQLVALYVIEWGSTGGKPPYDGAALFLSWRAKREEIRGGQESVLRCPGDPSLLPTDDPGFVAAYDKVDLANPRTDLCSYAVRDFTHFPLRDPTSSLRAIACCRQGLDGRTPHHRGGICVAFADGTARFVGAAELGLKPGEPIVVGPDSPTELLRPLIYAPSR
jgi:hypothetical protein